METIPLENEDDDDNWWKKDVSDNDDIIEENVSHNLSTDSVTIPTHHKMDFENLKSYIYPTNFEIRDYQYNSVKKAFHDNLLVALPTGLGKTFIASTIMLNFLRWFPDSKIIFMAPTRPLVAQQIKACCAITGIPSSKVAILLDKARKNRQDIWESQNVFFTTPQVVENDLCLGILNPKSIVLLVIDEAHRSRGNYAYNNVVKYIKRFNDSFRILALTATPASDVEGVQEIIDNLMISKVEVRTEQSIDIIKYMKRKQIVKRTILASDAITECTELLAEAIRPILKIANEKGALDITDPKRINQFQCLERSKKIKMDRSIPEGLKWSMHFMLQLLGMVGQCYKKLNNYGLKSFYDYFFEKYSEFKIKFELKKSKNKLNACFYFSDPVKKLLDRIPDLLKENHYSHPKIECLLLELDIFFNESTGNDSKAIIFTEFRDTALEIVQTIEQAKNYMKPHIFIGQAKEKERFDETKLMTKGKKKDKNQQSKKTSNNKSSSENAQQNGMSQKLQKEVIKDFKAGKFNILVATSIGEEGLDIGEVDLIICFDSTASPIKNIQRMGRTGRKRDGKVVLLFSSNEESKFDKAMGGYEYIQQHIMKGELINLHQQNRLIPNNYEPIVIKKFIEIPEENTEIKAEEDEDEIIRIATQYMLKSQKQHQKQNKGKSKKSTKKRFNMPENVETGFRTVTSMLKDASENNDISKNETDKSKNSQLIHNEMDVSKTSALIIDHDSNLKPNEIINDSDFFSEDELVVNDFNKLKDIENSPSKSKVNTGTQKVNQQASQKSKTTSIIDQLRNSKRRKLEKTPDINESYVIDDSDIEIIDDEELNKEIERIAVTTNHSEASIFQSPEIVYDEELNSVSATPNHSKASIFPLTEKNVFDFGNDEEKGILDDQQLMELHTNYYISMDPNDQVEYYDPIISSSIKKFRRKFESDTTKRLVLSLNTKCDFTPKFQSKLKADYDYSFIVKV
ncbi:unnamed protein product [Candida verbasci]|uniref:ATP-dependent DNA helicase n=1 Tax=Candida verbasci TaxID=1227364 RepID=A0A9W4TW80_9ASCO|nr:unnamed protein product [Candida verbasci]